jgi:hypothetical protein
MAAKVVIPFLELMVELATTFLISFQDVATTSPDFQQDAGHVMDGSACSLQSSIQLPR